MALAPVAIIPEATTTAVADAQQNKVRWFELGLVLVLAFGSSLAASIHVLVHGPAQRPAFSNEHWIVAGIHEIGCLALLGYILHRRGLRISNLGLKWSRRNLLVGFGLFLLASTSYAFALRLIQLSQHLLTGSYATPIRASQIFGHATTLAFLFATLNPFFEELIVRAYLMTEVSALTDSVALATIVSVLFQSSYHLYYGWTGAAALSFMFLVFATYYARTRNATPIVFAHFLFDIIATAYLAR
jgi:membrane protease YdiL (CAAX protease family)